uniref:UTP3 small subunit processome component n=1 Tax=Hippocampus comes TaxID=109280 RepID=A0A3Q2Z862_HIPCM
MNENVCIDPAFLNLSSQNSKDKIDEFHDEKIEVQNLCLFLQEEVMALDDSEMDDDDDDFDDEEDSEDEEGTDMESDLEGKKEEELPNELAWGTKKKMFYDSDYVATKGKSRDELVAEEEEEEEEAKKIQKRLAEHLSEEDYDLNFLQEFAPEEQTEATVVEKENIVKDLKQMSHKEKMKLLNKESPELLELIQDFKAKLTEMKDQVQPLMQMVKNGKIPPGKGADYLKTKQQLYLNYCTNISFYLVLKAKRIPAHNHPVIERLLTYRNVSLYLFIHWLGLVYHRFMLFVQTLEPRHHMLMRARLWMQDSGKVVAETGTASDLDLDEEAALRFYREVEERMKLKRKNKPQKAEEMKDVDEEEELDSEAKRGITYQMAKNRGLTPKRKKIDRNPRVKHREKFRRAKIRRKGQVREVRREETRYSGELSGIRAGVKKSIKLK